MTQPHPIPAQITDVFFDLDNTLWDYQKNAKLCLEALFPDFSKKFPKAVAFQEFYDAYYHSNESLWEKINRGEISKSYLRTHRFPDAFRSLGFDEEALGLKLEDLFLEKITLHHELVDGAVPLLDFFRQQSVKLHILSNGFLEVTHQKINTSALAGYFDTITSADELQIRKPDAKIYHHALRKAQAIPETALMIGDDWEADILGAQAIGMAAVYYTPTGSQPEAYPYTVSKLSDIPQLL